MMLFKRKNLLVKQSSYYPLSFEFAHFHVFLLRIDRKYGKKLLGICKPAGAGKDTTHTC